MDRFTMHRSNDSLFIYRQDKDRSHIHSILLPCIIDESKGIVMLRTSLTLSDDNLFESDMKDLLFIPTQDFHAWKKSFEWIMSEFFHRDIVEHPDSFSFLDKIVDVYKHASRGIGVKQWRKMHQNNRRCHRILTEFFHFVDGYQKRESFQPTQEVKPENLLITA